MLVLRRRVGETIVIDDETEITVLSVKGKHVRLGASAPRNVAIDRKETYYKKKLVSKEESQQEEQA